MRVIAIDPGVTTGYCYAEIVDDTLYYAPFQMVDDVDELWWRLNKFGPKYIIIEDFEFRKGKAAAGGLNLFPVQLIGVARLFETVLNQSHPGWGARLFLQKASTGKQYYTDAVLKDLKLYKRGIGHGMDASRHLLQWATFGYGYKYMGSTKDNVALIELEYFNA